MIISFLKKKNSHTVHGLKKTKIFGAWFKNIFVLKIYSTGDFYSWETNFKNKIRSLIIFKNYLKLKIYIYNDYKN